MPPAAKRARSDDGAPTIAECSKKVKCLSKENARAILAGLMASLPVARVVIEDEIAKVEPVDVGVYSRKASDIVCSLDRLNLRSSQHYGSAGEIQNKLAELVDECKEDLSSTQAFAAMVAILEVAHEESHSEARNIMFGDGAFDSQIAEELQKLAEDISSEEKESIRGAVDDLERLMKVLDDYGCGYDIEKVVTQMRGDQLDSRGPVMNAPGPL